ncbi:MAG: hypothetical protein ACLRIS_19250 [Flavonifractor plautii]
MRKVCCNRAGFYNTLNAEAALPVVERIAGIGTVTLESEAADTAARQAYTDYAGKFSGKDMVSNLNVLELPRPRWRSSRAADRVPPATGVHERRSGIFGAERQNPIVGSTKGEWAVLAQAWAGTLSEDVRRLSGQPGGLWETYDGILDTSRMEPCTQSTPVP